MPNEVLSIWDKFDVEVYKTDVAATYAASILPSSKQEPVSDTGPTHQLRKRLVWSVLNVISIVFWVYVPVKLFVGDFDRWIVSHISPSLLWILDYRFFILLGIFTIAFFVIKRWMMTGMLLYVLFFPLVILVWKIPVLLYRKRNWNVNLGVIQLIWSLGKSLKFGLVALTALLLAALVILLDTSNWLIWGAIVILLFLWAILLVRAVQYAIVPSKFAESQRKMLDTILDSEHVWKLAAAPPEAKRVEVTSLNKAQVDQLVNQAGMGLVLYSTSALWAEKLDQYRKSGTSVVFSAFAVVALIVQAVVIFTLINLAIYRMSPSEYAYSRTPRLMTFVRYAFTSMYPGEIEVLRPAGTVASAIGLIEGFSCAVIVLVLIVSVIFSLKQTQDDRVAEESIREMRSKADSFAAKLSGEYSLPLVDLMERLVSVGSFFGSWGYRISGMVEVIRRHSGERNEPS